ncbi:hypothetical protein BDA96_01G088000 [Sorghum bicolor]|uniref:Uncharacterized protein n=1 Tax=Sorghum bicolor TaxID=4558 RepID=A0A921RVY3_SORBI|nr:hypothetical protein BDA96_01G088000 [Sorghum bicolor]
MLVEDRDFILRLVCSSASFFCKQLSPRVRYLRKTLSSDLAVSWFGSDRSYGYAL